MFYLKWFGGERVCVAKQMNSFYSYLVIGMN